MMMLRSSLNRPFRILVVEPESELAGLYKVWLDESDIMGARTVIPADHGKSTLQNQIEMTDVLILSHPAEQMEWVGEALNRHKEQISVILITEDPDNNELLDITRNVSCEILARNDVNRTTLTQCVKLCRVRQILSDRNSYHSNRDSNGDLPENPDMSSNSATGTPVEQSDTIFLANLGHDLRSPIHGILSFANFGIKKIDTVDKDKIVEYMHKIRQCGNRLMSIINNLIDLSKLESGLISYDFRESQLSELITIAIQSQIKETGKKQLHLEFTPPESEEVMICDPQWILLVLKNIISNAIKFSPEGSDIKIEMENRESYLQFVVKDWGMGIPEGEYDAVFDKNAQTRKSRSDPEGTGMGLAICRKVIVDHNGTIRAEPNVPNGVRIIARLPKRQPRKTIKTGSCSENSTAIPKAFFNNAG